MYQLVELALIIRHGDEADPRLVWDSYRFRCSKLFINLLEEDELEATVKVVPITWYHRGLGLYGAHTPEPKNSWQDNSELLLACTMSSVAVMGP